MKLMVGLGNPGEDYRHTRHNVGFRTVDRLAERLGVGVRKRECFALTGDTHLDGRKLILAKPQTYMNLSGRAVSALTAYYKLPPEELLVVCDDLDLPFGWLRLRRSGGSGGHRGLASVIEHLRTNAFPRLRIGIGRGEEAVSYVLGRFGREEAPLLEKVLDAAVDAVLTAHRDGYDRAMNEYNNKEVGSRK